MAVVSVVGVEAGGGGEGVIGDAHQVIFAGPMHYDNATVGCLWCRWGWWCRGEGGEG